MPSSRSAEPEVLRLAGGLAGAVAGFEVDDGLDGLVVDAGFGDVVDVLAGLGADVPAGLWAWAEDRAAASPAMHIAARTKSFKFMTSGSDASVTALAADEGSVTR